MHPAFEAPLDNACVSGWREPTSVESELSGSKFGFPVIMHVETFDRISLRLDAGFLSKLRCCLMFHDSLYSLPSLACASLKGHESGVYLQHGAGLAI